MTDETLRSQFFPVDLPAGVTGRVVDTATAFTVGGQLRIFDPPALGHFQPPQSRQAQVQRLAESFGHSGEEAVVLYDADEKPVGWFWGYMAYADTFTIDTFGLIPGYRGRGVYSAFVRALLAYLTAVGYERVTVITHANNRAMLIANLKAGFHIAGMEVHESLGAAVKLAYLVHADRREDFGEAFRLQPDPRVEDQAGQPGPFDEE